MSGRGSQDQDLKVQACCEKVLPELDDWRLIVLTTSRSTFATSPCWSWPGLGGCKWLQWKGSLGAFGGPSTTHLRLQLRGLWPRRVSPRDWHRDAHRDDGETWCEMDLQSVVPATYQENGGELQKGTWTRDGEFHRWCS